MKFLTTSILILTCLIAQAQGIQFFDGSFSEAKAEAEKLDKLIFMDAYASWCGPCKKMAKNTFPKKEVGDFYNEKFINLKIDCEKGEGKKIRNQYKVSAYPTLLYLNSKGKVVHRTMGMKNVDGLLAAGKKALKPNQAQLAEDLKKFKAGERDKKFLFNLAQMLNAAGKDTDEVLQAYLSVISASEMKELENLRLIFDLTNSVKSPSIDVFSSLSADFKKLYGEDFFSNKVDRIVEKALRTAKREKSIEPVDKAIELLKAGKSADTKEKTLELHSEYYASINDWEKYDANVTKYIKKYRNNDADYLNETAWTYYMNSNKPSHIEKAIEWSSTAVKKKKSYQHYNTLAYLLYKQKDFTAAKNAATLALAEADKEKIEPKSSTALLKVIEKKEKAETENK